MERSRSVKALVLALRDKGESNREASFLTDTDGILHATIWGGPKSKLRSWVCPWHLGTLYLYNDPVRKSSKVTDFDIVNQFLGLRETLDRSWAANAISEVILQSPGAVGHESDTDSSHLEALGLVIETLEGLNCAIDTACRPLFLRWLWRWLGLMGLAVDTNYCARCACGLKDDEVVWYVPAEGIVSCDSCRLHAFSSGLSYQVQSREAAVPLSPALRRWLKTGKEVEAIQWARSSLDRSLLAESAGLIATAARNALGKELSVWNSWPV